jgi:hypothetical protein
MVFQRFYTYPPDECEWPWVLRNINQKPLPCIHEIVDIGIYDLLKPPHRHSEEKLRKWEDLAPQGWKVVPDCPDLGGEFGCDVDFNNLEYSWWLLEKYYNPNDPNHLPVIQSHYNNIQSFKDYIERFKDKWGLVDKIAVGSICKLDDNITGARMLKIIRREFPDSWIHAFGLRFKQFRKVYKLINSYDSTAWTFPRTPGRGSCKNKAERIIYFNDYISILQPYFIKMGQQFFSKKGRIMEVLL